MIESDVLITMTAAIILTAIAKLLRLFSSECKGE